jgi:hypothetical protein
MLAIDPDSPPENSKIVQRESETQTLGKSSEIGIKSSKKTSIIVEG